MNQLKITPLTENIGARVEGVDLSQPLDETTFGAVRQAFLDHLVLVFPGQDLSAMQQIAFTERFGKVEPHPLKARPGIDPEGKCIVLENKPGVRGARNDFWHSDISCVDHPPGASVLHGVIVPEGRGDTQFCNMYRAWDRLSDGMKALLRPLTAEHSGEALRSRNRKAATDGNAEMDVPPPARHPVLRRHAESGREALYTNTFFTTNFTGMTEAESKPILDLLEQVATAPCNVYRHRWTGGDVLMWDNRCTMHYAVYDYDPNEARRMHRTTAAGERPIAA